MDVYALEITHSLYLSMYLLKQADLTESFTSQKSSLPSSWNLRREKFKKNDWIPTVSIIFHPFEMERDFLPELKKLN